MQNGIGAHAPTVHSNTSRSRFRPDEKEVEAELANIDIVDTSKIAIPSEWKEEYTQRNLKRMLIVQTTETGKRKVCKSITTSISSKYLLTVPAPSALLHPTLPEPTRDIYEQSQRGIQQDSRAKCVAPSPD